MSLHFQTQIMTQVVWDKSDSDLVAKLQEFGWIISCESSKRTKNSTHHITVLTRVCNFSSVETITGGPAFVQLTERE